MLPVLKHSGLMVMVVVHLLTAVILFAVSYTYEKSIITDRKNKWLFFIISLIYSWIGTMIIVDSLFDLHRDHQLSVFMYRNSLVVLWIGFILVQLLVYKFLNQVEIREE
ncbi:hypothetical protein JF544_02770 [Halobacillus kuroshimensis]|uniref:Uncharacterized protein n=1 Tax=Halobacillus kuroshimensis TaxID=302481 RepID=A0ABS3DS36_9BACI|nr:hypothetical protein [Halobacillus kuroshimensis]MBN8234148.1 hypothetical protein [Halobacillus kuroshimensis]